MPPAMPKNMKRKYKLIHKSPSRNAIKPIILLIFFREKVKDGEGSPSIRPGLRLHGQGA